MRVYLDNCCYNRPYDDQTQMKISLEAQAKLHVQELIREDKLELASSWFVTYEKSKNPHDNRKKVITDFLEENVSTFISSERQKEVEAKAESITETGVKKMDACHIASAILLGCEYLLTTDKRMLKYKSGEIEVLNPTEFVSRLEELNDDKNSE